MTLYKLYRHEYNRDTAICPIEIKLDGNLLVVTFEVFNVHSNDIGCSEPRLIYPNYSKGQKPQTIALTREQALKWKEYDAKANYGVLREV